MLKSLFGDLLPLRETRDARDTLSRHQAAPEFVATALMDRSELTGQDDTRPAPLPTHGASQTQRDLFVSGSPAQAMRAHFSSIRDRAQPGTRTIALHDPEATWAPAVLSALSDASGGPVERLHLRDQVSMQVLATIARTRLTRRADDTLKVYHAQVQASLPNSLAIQAALMEHADLSVMVIGAQGPSVIDEWLAQLRRAVVSPHWRCPCLLILIPVGAGWIASKVDAVVWPIGLSVRTAAEPLSGASVIWNKLLGHWTQMLQPKSGSALLTISATPQPFGGTEAARASGWDLVSAFADTHPPELSPAPTVRSVHTNNLLPAGASHSSAYPSAASAYPGAPSAEAPAESASRLADSAGAEAALQELMGLDGVIFTALVDVRTGQVVYSPSRGLDIERAATAAADLLRLHRNTLRHLGHGQGSDTVDEVMVTAGSRYHVLRGVQARPDLLILAVLDKLRSNLAVTRYRIMEAQLTLR